MDHLIPIVRGGKSNKKNCVPSCKDCNSKKGYKMSVELTMENMAKKGSKEDADEGFE
jgi:5-methylcytosine-specific restriction protein A